MSRTNQIALTIPAMTVILTTLIFFSPSWFMSRDQRLETLAPLGQPESGSPASPNTIAPSPAVEEPQSPILLPTEQAEPAPPTATAKTEPEILVPLAATAVRLPIVEYHYSTFYFDGIMMKPEWFLEQMQWFAKEGFHSLTINELADFIDGSYAPPQPAVALTFDVGISHFDDYSQVVIPTLRRLGLHGIFFVQTQGVLEQCDGERTCWDSLASWLEEGLISVGSHTVYHRDFTTLPPAQILLELRQSKEVLQEKLGVTVIGVCYPFDAATPDAVPFMEMLGYRFAVGGYTRSERSTRLGDAEPYNLPRYYPYSNDALYPALTGSRGLPFAELMTAAVQPTQ